MAIYTNQGELFSNSTLEQINTFAEWKSPKVSEARRNIEELIEKRNALLEEQDISGRNETVYYWTSYVLRRLGFTFSVSEFLPEDETTRVDFTVFNTADSFRRARDFRAKREFFSDVAFLVRAIGWEESLDAAEESNPGIELSQYLRQSGVEWGILTNGQTWRLYNRNSVGSLDTYFEINVLEALDSDTLDDFRVFWMIFGPEGLTGQAPVVNRLVD